MTTPPANLPYVGIEGITAWEIDPRAPAPRVSIVPGLLPPNTFALEARWQRLCETSPRLYNAPVLSVLSFNPETNEILARRDTYQRLCVQPEVVTGVRLLAVTAALTAKDDQGRRYILLGQRSPQTRIFGNMWEIGPSGGVSPPPLMIDFLSPDALLAAARAEIAEELSDQPNPPANPPANTPAPSPLTSALAAAGVPVAYLRDHIANSDDLVLRFDLGRLEDVTQLANWRNWEYTQSLWTPIDTLSQFDTDETIAATRALFRVLGYISMY